MLNLSLPPLSLSLPLPLSNSPHSYFVLLWRSFTLFINWLFCPFHFLRCSSKSAECESAKMKNAVNVYWTKKYHALTGTKTVTLKENNKYVGLIDSFELGASNSAKCESAKMKNFLNVYWTKKYDALKGTKTVTLRENNKYTGLVDSFELGTANWKISDTPYYWKLYVCFGKSFFRITVSQRLRFFQLRCWFVLSAV